MNSIILLILIAHFIDQISSQFNGGWNGGGGGWGGGDRHRHHPGGFNGFGMPPPRPPPGWFSRWGGGFNGPPSPWEWRRRAWRFCRRFPGHPACRGGRSPEFSEVQNMEMQTRTQFLPRIPRITIQDPLIGVSPELTQIARSYRNYGYLDQSSYQSITTLCRSFNCREQSQESEQFRNTIQEKVVSFEQTISGKDNADNINLRFDRTLQIKQVLLEQANLTAQVTPEDNGVFDKDLLLTENQAHFLLNELGQGGKGKDIPNVPEPPPSPGGPGGPSGPGGPGAPQVQNQQSRPPWQNQQNNQNNQWNNNQQGGNQWGGQNWNGGRRWLRDSLGFSESFDERQKRAAIYFEQNLVQKWDLKQPIPYSFDASLDTQDKADVTNAIKEIEQKTCIRFKLGTNLKGNHINYQKIDSPTFCGLSYVGRVEPANPVYLSFQCGNAKGVAIHETMHALGVAHQHLRMDRDQHITVDWSNVNPRFYDTFVVSDSKLYTTYGVKYDYGSIMHYNAYTAAVNITKPTMVPKVSPATNLSKLGQRDAMSASDVELLKKMYCVKPGCDDKNVYCGAWALKNLCTTNTWLQANCKKSCNLCN